MSENKESYELDVADDLMAAALAAVDARMAPKKPQHDEMEAFAADLEIESDEDEDEDEGEVQIDLEMDLEPSDDMGLEIEIEDEEPMDSEEVSLLQEECDRLRKNLSASEAAGKAMKTQVNDALKQLRQHMSRSERNREKVLRLTSDAKNAIEARDAAENRSRALRETVNKLQNDLQRSLERRRKDLQEQKEQISNKIVSEFLPVVDHLQLALKHAEADPDTLIQGVQMVMGQFLKSIANHGVMPIPSNPGTPFDPHVHEAVKMIDDPMWDPNTVIDTVQVGYQIKGRLLRAARVVVSSAEKAFTEDKGESEEGDDFGSSITDPDSDFLDDDVFGDDPDEDPDESEEEEAGEQDKSDQELTTEEPSEGGDGEIEA